MKRKLGLFASLSILLALGASPAFSQAVTGSIVGNVTDPGGAAVAGAKSRSSKPTPVSPTRRRPTMTAST